MRMSKAAIGAADAAAELWAEIDPEDVILLDPDQDA